MSDLHAPARGRAGDGPSAPHSVPRRIVAGLLCLIGVAILLGLGVWQLQRLHWKEDLLARVAALRHAAARPLADVLTLPDGGYTRVSFDCPGIESRPRAKLFGVQDGQAGYRMMAACPVAGGAVSTIMVDLGFAPDTAGDCLSKHAPLWNGPYIGILRTPDPKSFVTPLDQPAQRLWYWRDLPSMTKALGAGAPAAYFVALEPGPQSAGWAGCLTQLPIPANIPNRHLEYAITWFGLAAALVGVYVASLFRRRQA
jgi:surfeit locus 1 family protein